SILYSPVFQLEVFSSTVEDFSVLKYSLGIVASISRSSCLIVFNSMLGNNFLYSASDSNGLLGKSQTRDLNTSAFGFNFEMIIEPLALISCPSAFNAFT